MLHIYFSHSDNRLNIAVQHITSRLGLSARIYLEYIYHLCNLKIIKSI